MKGRQLAAFEASSSDQLHRRPARRTWDGYAAFSIHLRGWPFRSTSEMLFAVLTTTERPPQARDIHHEPFFRRGNPGGGRRLGLALAALTLALLGTLLSLPGGSLTTGSGAGHEALDPLKLFGTWMVRDVQGQPSGSLQLGGRGYFPDPSTGTYNLLLPCGG